MKKLFLSLVFATLACANDDEGPAPITSLSGEGTGQNDDTAEGEAGEDSDEAGEGGVGSEGGVDSSGGNVDCSEEQFGKYSCSGWAAGVYCRNTDPTCTNPQIANGADLYAECFGNPKVQVCSEYLGTDDNPLVMEDCKDECNRLIEDESAWQDWPTPVGSGAWDLVGVACVMAPNGNNGTVPIGTLVHGVGAHANFTTTANISGAANLDCDNIGPVGGGYPTLPQTFYQGCFDDSDLCMAAFSCTGWNPTAQTTYSYCAAGCPGGTSRVHTVTVSRGFLWSLFNGDWPKLHKCDPGSLFGTQSWAIVGSASGDLLYRFGLRLGDYNITFKKNPTGTTYTLTSFTSLINAMTVALTGVVGDTFTVTFRRPVFGGTYLVHTVNITLTS